MFYVYKVSVDGYPTSYYGYCDSSNHPKKTFLVGATRDDEDRADNRWFQDAAGGDEELLKIDIIDLVDDEYEAFTARNDLRASNPDSATPPHHFPPHLHRRAKEQDPDRAKKWNSSVEFSTMRSQGRKAREFYQKGYWTQQQIMALATHFNRADVLRDLDYLTADQFQQKYSEYL